MSEQNKQHLEERIAYLEDTIDKLGLEMNEMFNSIRSLQAQIRILAKRQEEGVSAVCPQSEETPPPHY